MTTYQHNPDRIRFQLERFRLTVSEFLRRISEKLSNPIEEKDVFGEEIKANHLKRVDKLFKKGINYYLDPSTPKKNKKSSVFFRKNNFRDTLNFRTIQRVNEFEELQTYLSALEKMNGERTERILPIYTVEDNPIKIALEIRGKIVFSRSKAPRRVLEKLVTELGKLNILVLEFVEHPALKEKANVNGFFLQPNMLVVKRITNQKRELFTLAHELGHYLLNEEEIETVDFEAISNNKIEKWCDQFAFAFLMGDDYQTLANLPKAKVENDYHHDKIKEISDRTNVSQLAIYTNLKSFRKISNSDYSKVYQEARRISRLAEANRAKQMLNEPSFARTPKPFISPFLQNQLTDAYYNGLIDRYEVGRLLRKDGQDLDKIFDE